MKQSDPPGAAMWMLRHMTPGEPNEALTGDLLEELRSGRSPSWFWRQAVAAVTIAWAKDALRHLDLVLFAVVWATLAPAWLLICTKFLNRYRLIGGLWGLPWPWSTISAFALAISHDLMFVWAGLLLYFVLRAGAARPVNQRRLWKAILQSASTFIVVWLTVLACVILIPHSAHPINVRTVTPMSRIADFTLGASLQRLPFFVAMLFALWGASRRTSRRQTPVRP